jgi:hypothetical protein
MLRRRSVRRRRIVLRLFDQGDRLMQIDGGACGTVRYGGHTGSLPQLFAAFVELDVGLVLVDEALAVSRPCRSSRLKAYYCCKESPHA